MVNKPQDSFLATRYKPDRIVFDGTRVVLLDFKAPPLVLQEHIMVLPKIRTGD